MTFLKITLALLTLSSSFAMGEIKCEAVKEWLDNGNLEREITPMPLVFSNQGYKKYQVDLEDAIYTLNITDDKYVSSINFAPDYTTGVISSGIIANRVDIKLNYVFMTDVFKLRCKNL